MIAVDTNVLVGAVQTFDPQLRITARRSVRSFYRQGEQLLCFPQNLVEFWNVSTRPASANGLGFTPEQAARLRGPISDALAAKWQSQNKLPGAYMKEPSETVVNAEPLSAGMSAALLLPAAGTLVLGIFPSWVLDFAGRSSSFLR